MKRIINFIDENVDGCGTDISVYVQIEGDTDITNGVLACTKNVIEDYKACNKNEYTTDDVIEAACRYLTKEGYRCEALIPYEEICF